MRRFLSELPKLIISSGLVTPCQEQEPAAKPRPGWALPATSYPHPSHLDSPPPTRSPCSQLRGRMGAAARLPVRAGPSLARRHGAFACSGVLIKPFIVLHSRKELRRNTERDGGEESEREGRKEKRRGRKGEGMSDLPLFAFFFALSQALKRCLIWSVGSREVDKFFLPTISRVFFPLLSLP